MSEKIEELARALRASLNFEGEDYSGCYSGAETCRSSSCECLDRSREAVRALYPLIAAEMAGVVRDPNLVDQVSRVLAAGWRGNPNMSGDDRDFMPGPMRRRHDDRTATACEYIATAILAHVKTIE